MLNRRALILLLVIPGCSEEPYPDGSCRFSSDLRSSRPIDDAAQLGFSGADLIAAVNARPPGALAWHDGATTTITVEATPPSDTAMVYAPPPNEGYCSPSIDVDADLHLVSADGRLDVIVRGYVNGNGYDGTVHTIFPNARVDLPQPNQLQLPASWSSAQRTSEELLLDFHIEPAGGGSPYCGPGEDTSGDPNVSCNDYDGVLSFFGSDPEADGEQIPDGAWFRSAVGWWTW